MSELVTLFKKPKLNRPTFIAAWPGMGNVAILAVDYLKRKLGAELMGEVEPADFFAPTGATVSRQVIRAPETPVNQFFYYQSASSDRDILFFMGSVQPVPHREHAFAVEILKIAQKMNARAVFTTAAAPSDMHFKDTPRVFAVPNHPDLLAKMTEYKVHFMSDGTIAGLNGLLVGVAAGLGIPGTCLLGEIPFFTAQMEFPRASVMVLKILNKILGIKIDMVDLDLYAVEKDKEIEPIAAMLTKNQTEEGVQNTESPIVPDQQEEQPVSRSVSIKIEKLFKQAEFDRTYKSKMRLKEELDKWGLFDEYLDRFLDLFKKTQGEV
jgi:proteasome assembly chaperone (PAC2) family protein